MAVILDPDYEQLLGDADAAVDCASVNAAREDDDYVPWDEVKADLGLTRPQCTGSTSPALR
jgi:hypothetical protein